MLSFVLAGSMLVAVIAQPANGATGRANQQQAQQTAPDKQRPDGEIDQSRSPTITINNQMNPPTRKDHEERSEERRHDPISVDWWGAINSGLLTIFTLGLVVVTGGLVFVGWLQTKILGHHSDTFKTMLSTFRTIERAYVTMSHLSPGIEIDEIVTQGGGDVARQQVSATIRIMNVGNTPARVIRTLLHPCIAKDQQSVPKIPPYDESLAQGGRVFLVKNDSFQFRSKWNWPASEIHSTLHGPAVLCLIGYVDYVDRFGRFHRAGYGRYHDSSIDDKESGAYAATPGSRMVNLERYINRNNLPFITNENYNYDIETDERGNPKPEEKA